MWLCWNSAVILDLCKLTILAHLRFLRTFSMFIWGHHSNALRCQKFSCNSIPVKRYFSWTIDLPTHLPICELNNLRQYPSHCHSRRRSHRHMAIHRWGNMLTLKVLNFWKFTSYRSLKPLWSGIPRRPYILHPLPLCINCRN